MARQVVSEEEVVPVWTVARVVAVVEEEFLALADIPDCGDAGNEAVPGMLEEPLGAVVLKVVVDLVAQGRPVVLGVHEVPGQVHPLPPHLLRVGEDLVAGFLPALLLPVPGRKTYLKGKTSSKKSTKLSGIFPTLV